MDWVSTLPCVSVSQSVYHTFINATASLKVDEVKENEIYDSSGEEGQFILDLLITLALKEDEEIVEWSLAVNFIVQDQTHDISR